MVKSAHLWRVGGGVYERESKKRGKNLRPNLSYNCHITSCCPLYQMHCELMNPFFICFSSFLFIGLCGPL
ncbi:hypothetical protein PRUPE_6G087000 [Prunus persica]|uniref:Uncharacterized protein n=1 Tax=Prunus persica TaxID=3760 RepID=A0A251NM48_PRUPE|nr:hypothetical protein PRUPE_6G087000 [Prunus persica]